MSFTQLDLAYFAALLDGEGWITFERANKTFSLRVGVANTCKLVLQQLMNEFGGGVRKQHKVNYQVWTWSVSQHKAKRFLEAVLPYMRIKQGEAKIALEFLNTLPTNTSKIRVTDEELQRRLLFKERLISSRYSYTKES